MARAREDEQLLLQEEILGQESLGPAGPEKFEDTGQEEGQEANNGFHVAECRAGEPYLARQENAPGTTNYTLLMFASANDHTDMVEYLLDQGADPNSLDADQRSALFLAAAEGHWQIAQILLRRGGQRSLDHIRADDKRPYVMAPLYEIAGEFYLEKNNKRSSPKRVGKS